ncbi:MAG TPA: hypothetical protein VMT30_02470 [Candidatus Saccharimonadia bacterium]|nr:hypothetical protein [Candidatus Saccharimonadia bacterium]
MRTFAKLILLYFAAVAVLSIANNWLKPGYDQRVRNDQLRQWELQAQANERALHRR